MIGTPITGLPRIVTMGVLGALMGAALTQFWNIAPISPSSSLSVPEPYRIPKIPGGTALRMAMVHDVIHERYVRHGAAWYTQRNMLAKAVIAEEQLKKGPPSQRYLDALDDLAVGLDRTGDSLAAVEVMRTKLSLLPAPATQPTAAGHNAAATADSAGTETMTTTSVDMDDLMQILAAEDLPPMEQERYSAHANLGTVLIHSSMADAMHAILSNGAALQRVREGIDHLETSVTINPGAHFGREIWQILILRHFLAGMNDREFVEKYDVIGDALTSQTPARTRGIGGWEGIHLHALMAGPEAELSPGNRIEARRTIPRVYPDPKWLAAVAPLQQENLEMGRPFDEPVLAMIGLWTLGGGPNPNLAIALGHVMESVGQRYIAWTAYERAVELQDKLWPDPVIREHLVQWLRERQSAIAQEESPKNPEEWTRRMRAKHVAELAWGQAYQKEYQDYEASQIAAGMPLNASTFYDAFFKGRPQVASVPGDVDDFEVTKTKASGIDLIPMALLSAGVLMMLGVIFPEKNNVRAGREA